MSARQIIQDHDKWRKGMGGAPAGLVGESDANAYAGLDLDLITFSASTFNGSSFSATTFKGTNWSSCQFQGCAFSMCDFEGMRMTGCSFTHCTFERSSFRGSEWRHCTFIGCTWKGLEFDNCRWLKVGILECDGKAITAGNLQGEQVDFSGSNFQDMELVNARIN